MKRFLLFVVLMFVCSISYALTSAQCRLYWDHEPLADDPTVGFRFYDHGNFLFTLDDPAARDVSCLDLGIGAGAYSLTMTALSASEESEHSNTLLVTLVTIPAPTNLRLTVTVVSQ